MPRCSPQGCNEDQLGLALTGEGFAAPAETKGLLSLAYLLRHLKKSDSFASQSDVETAYEQVCA